MSELSGLELETEFQRIVLLIQNLPKDGPYKPSDGKKLKFYSLYKQATEGPCNIPRPSFLDFVGKTKWDSWSALGDMFKDDAKRAYIEAYRKMEVEAKEMGLSL